MKISTSQHRTAQVWSVLVLAARHQEIISYATIGKLTGLHQNGIHSYLDGIADYCNKKHYPELWSIVVNQQTGFPGSGGMNRGEELDILRKQQRVFAFDWLSHPCPQAQDFE